MKRISFSLTMGAFLRGEKTVTRRLGWKGLQAGDRLLAVDRVMGFRKGEHQKLLGEIEVVSVRDELLSDITDADVVREGFPGMGAQGFVDFFCREMKVQPDQEVRRIEFRIVRLHEDPAPAELQQTLFGDVGR